MDTCGDLGYRNLALDHQIKGKSHFTSSDGPDSQGKSALSLLGWPWIAKARFLDPVISWACLLRMN